MMTTDSLIILSTIVGSIVVTLGATVVIGMQIHKRVNRNCQRMAEELGLTYRRINRIIFGRPVLEGFILGKAVYIHDVHLNSSSSCVINMEVSYPGSLTFTIMRRIALLSDLGTIFSKNVVKTGDVAFDDQMLIRSSNPQYISTALIPELRQRIIATWAREGLSGQLSLEGPCLCYNESGKFSSTEVCRHLTAVVSLMLEMTVLVDAYVAENQQ